jgi:phosphotransferase system HPr (HPr) family protein
MNPEADDLMTSNPEGASGDREPAPELRAGPGADELEADFEVVNTMGLHVRPATNLAMAAERFRDTDVWLIKDGVKVDAKTPLLILTVAGVVGTRYTLRSRGPEAREALTELLALAARKFDVEGD